MMRSYLDFEKPVAELEAKVEELRAMQDAATAVAIAEDIGRLEAKAAQALKDLYANADARGRRPRSRAIRSGRTVSTTSAR